MPVWQYGCILTRIFSKIQQPDDHYSTERNAHDRSWCGELFFILSGQPATVRRRTLLAHACDLLKPGR
ncbi:MAG TPA: hypothetical protein VF266_27690, partial [Thermoanaerobaculia bacterium]